MQLKLNWSWQDWIYSSKEFFLVMPFLETCFHQRSEEQRALGHIPNMNHTVPEQFTVLHFHCTDCDLYVNLQMGWKICDDYIHFSSDKKYSNTADLDMGNSEIGLLGVQVVQTCSLIVQTINQQVSNPSVIALIPTFVHKLCDGLAMYLANMFFF